MMHSRPASGLASAVRSASYVAIIVFLLGVVGTTPPLRAANQTATLSPVNLVPDLNYQVQVQPVTFGASLPTLQSFAVGEANGKWVFISGRTNGLHGFDASLPN